MGIDRQVVIVDRPALRTSYEELLKSRGIEPQFFPNYNALLDEVASSPYPLCIILGYEDDPRHVGRLDAIALIRRQEELMRGLGAPQPPAYIIASTGGGPEVAERAVLAGANGVIYKPFTIDNLVDAVKDSFQ